MQRSNKIVGLALLSLISTTAMAETLQQKGAHKKDEKALNDDLNGPGDSPTAAQKADSLNGLCGTTMTAAYDWTGFDKLPFPPPFAPSQYGHDFLMGVRDFCRLAADNKAAVKDKIHKLVIVYGGGDKKSSFTLAGGTFTYTIGDTKKGSTNNADVRDFLGSHM